MMEMKKPVLDRLHELQVIEGEGSVGNIVEI